jgi:tetratricopeptide (TPR) repeat protein
MKDRLLLTILALILTLASGRALADDGDDNASPGDPEGSISLAEHFATFAHQTFHQDKIPAKALELNAALYRAAIKLNPNEPRFSRALADIMLEMNDVPGAMDALKKYMALVPADQTAQVQFVDLCLASDGMQSLDQRLSYLRSLLQKQQIPDPVKSEIAYRAAQLLMDRGQNDEAMKLLDSARVLNPMNLKVLRIRYILTQATALPVDRVQQLLGILQANPADPVVASRLAEQLAQLGLVGPATSWYGLADQLYTATNVRADPAFVLGASSELLLAKDTEHSTLLSSRYVAVRPDDADGWFVLLSIRISRRRTWRPRPSARPRSRYPTASSPCARWPGTRRRPRARWIHPMRPFCPIFPVMPIFSRRMNTAICLAPMNLLWLRLRGWSCITARIPPRRRR